MGNCCVVEGAIDHWVYVKTGDRKSSNTNVILRAILHDVNGNQSPIINLDCLFNSDFEKNKPHVFQAPSLGDFSDVVLIEFWRENDGPPDWFCEVIIVNDRRTERNFYFPVQRWVKPRLRYKMQVYDTLLPQLDPNKDQRDGELAELREVYRYGQKADDLPVQVAIVPENEQFSDDFMWDFTSNKAQMMGKAGITRIGNGPFGNMQALLDFYENYPTFPAPKNLSQWASDVKFGAQRLVGCNPIQIKLCTALPENFGVTADMLKPYLEGWTLKQVVQAKRLFLTDYKILHDLPCADDYPVCAPIGLFLMSGDKELLPIAIQLHQEITPNNPVFLPSDPPYTWIAAKMWLNNADATIHQAVLHVGFTHLLMEGVAVALHRNLSVCHPIHRLLAPHFLHMVVTNKTGINNLIDNDSWFDKYFGIGREGLLHLVRKATDDWRLDRYGCLPKELELRGVQDPKTLPNYSYRDDGMLVYKAIENYVTKIVKYYYDQPGKVKDDNEIQFWAAELSRAKEQGGVGMKGVPGQGKFSTVEELILTCICMIFICTAHHAAIHFPQYEEYAFPPNYPTFLHGNPPTTKDALTEDDLAKLLPDQEGAIEIIATTRLLSMARSRPLAEWEYQFQYDPKAIEFEKQFREELKHISQTIKQRNATRAPLFQYPYLDPERIPNAINA